MGAEQTGKERFCMELPRQDRYTIKDIYNLPDGTRAELIDGRIFYMAPPSRKHQRIVTELSTVINNYIKSNSGECEINVAPFAVFLSEDESNYVEPDISIVCDSDKLNDRGCCGAPDWIIEVVSPGSNGRRMDYMTKLFKYQEAGVREYWIVDPIDETITVYDFEHSDMGKYSFGDKIAAGIYEDLEIDFASIDYM